MPSLRHAGDVGRRPLRRIGHREEPAAVQGEQRVGRDERVPQGGVAGPMRRRRCGSRSSTASRCAPYGPGQRGRVDRDGAGRSRRSHGGARRARVDSAGTANRCSCGAGAQSVHVDVERDPPLLGLVPFRLVAAGAVLHVQEAQLDVQASRRARASKRSRCGWPRARTGRRDVSGRHQHAELPPRVVLAATTRGTGTARSPRRARRRRPRGLSAKTSVAVTCESTGRVALCSSARYGLLPRAAARARSCSRRARPASRGSAAASRCPGRTRPSSCATR